MIKYSLSLLASGIVISMAFLQCNTPATTEAEETIQLDSSLAVMTAESEMDSVVIPLDKMVATAIDKPVVAITVEKPKVTTANKPVVAVTKPKTIAIIKPEPVAAPKPTATTTDNPKVVTVEKPVAATPTEKPVVVAAEKPIAAPTEKPIALISADFSLKAVNAIIKGTSTLHDWESKVTIMEGGGSFQLKDNVLASIKDAEIKILVRGIISEEGDKMDNKTYEAFQSDRYPYIIYSFSNAVININDAHVVSVATTGNLSMAGASRPVALLANGKELPNGDLQLTVSKTIKMTDFNMEPPTMFLGTIKVGDEITVSFDFVLSKI
jgi:hypothetical protein